MRLPIVTVLLATALMGSYGSASAKPGATFALVITALQNPVKTGSEVKVEIVATNISKREIVIYREIWEGQAELAHYACEVRDDKGNPIAETKFSRAMREPDDPKSPLSTHVPISNGMLLPLKPGGKLKDMMIVSKFWDMSHPGVYEIQIVRTDPETGVVVKSNSISVTVVP